MHFYLFLTIIAISAIASTAYKIPNVDFELLKDGFQVSIPDEPGVRRVFYMFEIDDTCPAVMDYITEGTPNWTSTQKRILQNNDKLVISIIVQFNDDIYDKSEIKYITNNKVKTSKISKTRNHNFSNECQNFTIQQQETRNSSCVATETLIRNNQGAACQGDIVFEDEFVGKKLNVKTWKHDVRQRLYVEDEELVAYEDEEDICYVRDGILNIVPTISRDVFDGAYRLGKRCTAIEKPELECNVTVRSFFIRPPVISAQIHTRDSFSFKYGRIEVRAKLPKGDWLFPYIMLQPISTHSETHYSNQMRIAFARGNINLKTIQNEDVSGSRLYGGAVIWKNKKPSELYKNYIGKEHFGNDFHVYTLIWQRDKLTLAVDGESYGEIYDGLEFFNERCFIIFGVTVGGFWNFNDDVIDKKFKPYINAEPKAALKFWDAHDDWAPTWRESNALKIDYVRVYAV